MHLTSLTILALVLCAIFPASSGMKKNGAGKKRNILPCPNLDCAEPQCDKPKQTFGRLAAKRCKACMECPKSKKLKRNTIAPGELIPCPNNVCEQPTCTSEQELRCEVGRLSFANKDCQACCFCSQNNSKRKPTKNLRPCSHITCPVLDRPCLPPAKLEFSIERFQGIKCQGCGICVRPPVKCPESCPQVQCQSGYRRERSPGCDCDDSCEPLEECPVIHCPDIDQTCEEGFEFVQRVYELKNGKICMDCPACLPVCPAIDCPAVICPGESFPTTIIIVVEERQCPGCPKCDGNDCCNPICPAFVPKCQPGEEVITSPRITDGTICQGCPRCAPQCAKARCPEPKCRNPVPSLVIQDGRPCRGCPTCLQKSRTPTFECPRVRCPAGNLQCPSDKEHVSRAYEYEGIICEGCPACLHACLPLPCPPTDCPPGHYIVQNYIIQNERKCSGCTSCEQGIAVGANSFG